MSNSSNAYNSKWCHWNVSKRAGYIISYDTFVLQLCNVILKSPRNVSLNVLPKYDNHFKYLKCSYIPSACCTWSSIVYMRACVHINWGVYCVRTGAPCSLLCTVPYVQMRSVAVYPVAGSGSTRASTDGWWPSTSMVRQRTNLPAITWTQRSDSTSLWEATEVSRCVGPTTAMTSPPSVPSPSDHDFDERLVPNSPYRQLLRGRGRTSARMSSGSWTTTRSACVRPTTSRSRSAWARRRRPAVRGPCRASTSPWRSSTSSSRPSSTCTRSASRATCSRRRSSARRRTRSSPACRPTRARCSTRTDARPCPSSTISMWPSRNAVTSTPVSAWSSRVSTPVSLWSRYGQVSRGLVTFITMGQP